MQWHDGLDTNSNEAAGMFLKLLAGLFFKCGHIILVRRVIYFVNEDALQGQRKESCVNCLLFEKTKSFRSQLKKPEAVMCT